MQSSLATEFCKQIGNAPDRQRKTVSSVGEDKGLVSKAPRAENILCNADLCSLHSTLCKPLSHPFPPCNTPPPPPPIWRNILSKFPPVGKVTAGGLVPWFNEPWWGVPPSPLRGCSAWSPTAKSTCLTLKICCRRLTTRCAPCLPLARSLLILLSCTHSFIYSYICS